MLPEILVWTAELRSGLEFGVRLRAVLIAGLLSAVYLKTFVRRVAPGLISLIMVLPVVLLNIWLPLLFDRQVEILTIVTVLLSITWLASYKALGLCMHRGPLVDSWNICQFSILYLMPVYPKTGSSKKGRLADSIGSFQIMKSLGLNAALLCITVYMLVNVNLPTYVEHYTYGLGLCSFITIIMDGPGSLMITLLDLELVPPFDNPWLMTSLRDFWGRRWNNSTSHMLRFLIYDPVVEGRLIPLDPTTAQQQQQQQQGGEGPGAKAAGPCKKPNRLLQMLGMAATFGVSGLMHEMILMYVADPYLPGYWFIFFFSQAPLITLESMAYRALKKRGTKMNPVLGAILANCVLLMTTHFFFFPPVELTGLAGNMVAHVASSIKSVVSMMGIPVPA